MNEQTKQEPVVWFILYEDSHEFVFHPPKEWQVKQASEIQPLYEEPPKREWVGLTDDDEVEFEWERVTGHSIFGGDPWDGRQMFLSPNEILEFVEVIEAKLREKNMEVEE